MKSVFQIMSTQVITISVDDTLEKVTGIFRKSGFHHVLVMDGDKLVGVISDRDVLNNLSPFIGKLHELPRDIATLGKKAFFIMSGNPVTIPPEMTVSEAASIMYKKRISCLPVMGQDGLVKGIVTTRDILKYLAESA